MTELSARFGIPYLLAGQGQKDVTHNEAITMLDFLVQPTVVSRSLFSPPSEPAVGEAWLVGPEPTEAWFGMSGRIAGFTLGGWRFLTAATGMQLWVVDEQRSIRFDGAYWQMVAPFDTPAEQVDPPAGGVVVDLEARAAIEAILARLSSVGLVE